MGIDCRSPRLSWTLSSPVRAQSQTAYQILVAGSEAQLQANTVDLWDSGKVLSAQCLHIVYNGKPLTSGMRCWWKVRVWDGADEPAAYSEADWWEMGLLEQEDWQAFWIGLELPASELEPVLHLRRALQLSRPVQRARLYATAKGVYEVHLNGTRVSDTLFAPGWTDYRYRIQYQTYDVTPFLQMGENMLGALLGTGWYCGHVGFAALTDNIYSAAKKRQHYGTPPFSSAAIAGRLYRWQYSDLCER